MPFVDVGNISGQKQTDDDQDANVQPQTAEALPNPEPENVRDVPQIKEVLGPEFEPDDEQVGDVASEPVLANKKALPPLESVESNDQSSSQTQVTLGAHTLPPEAPVSSDAEASTNVQPDLKPIPEVLPAPPEVNKVEVATVDGTIELDSYLDTAAQMNASDIHFTVGYRAFIRVDGQLQQLTTPLLTAEVIEKYVEQLFKHRGIDNYQEYKDMDMSYETASGHRFRTNIYMQQGSFAIAMRLIGDQIKTLEQLGLPQSLLSLADLPYGLVLVTGPTGSGKSTTLASIINHINTTKSKHIITIEDPVEYLYPKAKSKVVQRRMQQDTDSWVTALRAVLRQDPNVVLVGEMRDYETIAAAITIAETGHLVFATLHTNTAAQTLDRLVDVFPEHQQSQVRVQLAGSLQAVVSQRLVPVNTGNGRVPAVEILMATDAVRASIRENKVHQIDNIIQTSSDVGMISLERSLVNLVRAGKITTEQAQTFTNRPEEVLAMLSKS